MQNNNLPLISVIMNCYNGESYLKEAIDSVINQTYPFWEIIFWDNQSSDNSAKIFSKYLHLVLYFLDLYFLDLYFLILDKKICL